MVSLGRRPLSDSARASLHYLYNLDRPENMKRVTYLNDRHRPTGSHILVDSAIYYEYFNLDGHRITPLDRSLRSTAGSSIVKVVYDDQTYGAEIISLFSHSQRGIPDAEQPPLYAEVRWMIELDISPTVDDPWSDL
jgi:hypothetical protein